ncbi:MAG: FtsX-like permease family protein [Deltaproteobacteria bacterium]|nr:FtsX-like permease family protein [Deltaproteobacteria bacterium]
MGYPLQFAVRYLGARKRASISAGTAFAILGVALGVAALATIMSVTGGFHQQFREKVLGVNAHVLVLKYSTNFREYREVMARVAQVNGVIGVAPFSINPMMVTHGESTATGVLVKGVDPELSLGVAARGSEWTGRLRRLVPVLDLPRYIVAGSLDGLRLPEAKPAPGSPVLELAAPPGGGLAPAASGSGRVLLPALPPAPRMASALPSALPGLARSAPATGSDAPPASAEDLDGGLPDGAPVGLVEPGGGYRSLLPVEDELPPEVDPDLCADPQQVLKLPGMVVGVSLAKTLGLHIGDCLTVTSPTIGFAFSGGKIKPPVAKRFRVIAIFEAGFDQYDSKLVYTDLFEAQTFYDYGDTVTGVEMKVDDIDRAREISAEIAGMLAGGLYHTMDWEELNHGLFTALRIQQIGMSAVLALIIVVAAFTVVATLIMVVLDKTKEISVLKAMGATDRAILRIFLYQGGIIGLCGTSAGLLLGLAVCKGLLAYGFPLDPKVYFISRLPVQTRPLEFIITGVIALAICLVATIIPSLYAARLRPADGFRSH